MSYSGEKKKRTKVATRAPALSGAGHDEDAHGEDGAHVKLLILHLLFRQFQGEQKHPVMCCCVVVKAASARFGFV